MRVLWLVNRVLPMFCEELNIKQTNYGGGWLTGLSNSLRESGKVELAVCAPQSNISEIKKGSVKSVGYYFYPEKDVRVYLEESVTYLKQIVDDFRPDVIHVFGTEYPRALEMIDAVGADRILISLTGILGECAPRYNGGLPSGAVRPHRILRCIAKRIPRLFFLQSRLVAYGQEDFYARAEYETKAIQKARYVTGRTRFDKDYVKKINNDLTYFFCNESLRNTFYKGDVWQYEECRPHSVFISNSGYPLKGFHQMLIAAGKLREKFPDIRIYVAGNSPFATRRGWKSMLLHATDEYAKYIKKLIKQNKLENNVEFLGNLNEEQMKTAFLHANVFVLPSIIENSPNSLGEAMLLGMPCVAADVGGVPEMMHREDEGMIYPFEDTDALANGIAMLFEDIDRAKAYGQRAMLHAKKTHSVSENNQTMLAIYNEIAKR